MRIGTIERMDHQTGDVTIIEVTLADRDLAYRVSTTWRPDPTAGNSSGAVFNWAAISDYWPDRHVVCAQTSTDYIALMQLDDDYRSFRGRSHDQRAVYVSFLEVAPRYRGGSWQRRFKGLGAAMLSFAVARSRQLGFGGRIGLHSIVEARAFYAKLGFREVIKLEPGFNEYWEAYLELPPEAADRFV